MSDAGEPIEPKKKLSRKAHLKALADERRKRGSASSRGEEQDPDYRPVPPVEEIEEGGVQMEVEEVGAASQREDSRQRKRLSRERVRGVSSMAGAMEHFLMQATPTEFSREKARRRLCADVAASAVAAVKLSMAVEFDAERRRVAAAQERERVRRRKDNEVTPPSRRVCPRLSTTFSEEAERKRQRPEWGGSTKKMAKRAIRHLLTPPMIERINRITDVKQHKFLKTDLVDGDKLSPSEWAKVQNDHLELRKVYAIKRFIDTRESGATVRASLEEAAKLIVSYQGKHAHWRTVWKWLKRFVENDGLVKLDQRGRKQSTPSFLTDPHLKAEATEWLREELRKSRAKGVGKTPLTVKTFREWVNSTLLKDHLASDRTLKPIAVRTALRSIGARVAHHCQ